MPDEIGSLREEVAQLRARVEAMHAELVELRAYIGEVPSMECGITTFEEWRAERAPPA